MGDLYRKRITPLGGAEKSLDDIVSRNVLSQLKRDLPPMTKNAAGKSDDPDLVSSMAKRLSVLEKELKEKYSIIHRLQQENDSLKGKLKVAEEEIQKRAVAALSPGDDTAALSHLRSENQRLRTQSKLAWKQVAEMKGFLNDYGMVWVGEPEPDHGSDDDGSAGSSRVPASSSAPAPAAAGAGPSPRPAPPSGGPMPPRPPSSDRASADRAPVLGRRRSHSEMRPSGPSGPSGADSAPPTPPDLDQPSSSAAAPAQPSSSSAPPASKAPSGSSGTSSPKASSSPSSSSSAAASSSAAPLPFNMQVLMSRVDELNQLAGDGCGQLMGGADGKHAVLSTPDPVRLVLYRDGLQLHRAAPRPYTDAAARGIINDIVDGYFPYSLKSDFPDGVPIKVVDRTHESMASAAPRGQQGNIRTFHDIEAADQAPLSKDKFLSKLPQAIIKNGKVIDIRGEIGKVMAGGPGAAGSSSSAAAKPSVALVSTPVDALLTTSQRNHVGPVLPPPSREGGVRSSIGPAAAALPPPAAATSRAASLNGATPLPAVPAQPPQQQIATLQVKSEDGSQTYIVKLQYTDTIAAVRKYLDAHRAKLAKDQGKPAPPSTYELRTAFPTRAYADLTETLQAAGLTPNATMFLRAVQPA